MWHIVPSAIREFHGLVLRTSLALLLDQPKVLLQPDQLGLKPARTLDDFYRLAEAEEE
jgi:hypothetical protein